MQIENFKVVVGEKYLATFDVYIEKLKLTLRNFRILRSKKGKLFPVRPSFSQGQGEDRKFLPLFSFGLEFDKEFDKQLNEAVDPFLNTISED